MQHARVFFPFKMLWNIALVYSTAVSFYSRPHIQLGVINNLIIFNISIQIILSNTMKKTNTENILKQKKNTRYTSRFIVQIKKKFILLNKWKEKI